MAASSSSAMPDHKLYVTANADGDVVQYCIYSRDKALLKTTRYSELSQLHAKIYKEVPSFSCRLPRKTMRRHTDAEFVETRRDEIEAYLQNAASEVSDTTAWIEFFTSTKASSSARSKAASSAIPSSLDGSQATAAVRGTQDMVSPALGSQDVHCHIREEQRADDEPGRFASRCDSTIDVPCESLGDDFKMFMVKKNSAVCEAQETEKELTNILAAGEKELEAFTAKTTASLAVEQEAQQRLTTHESRLEALENRFVSTRAARKDKESEQSAAAQRFSDELETVRKLMKSSCQRFEEARRARLEAAAVAKFNIDASSVIVVSSSADLAAITENRDAVAAALAALKARDAAKKGEVKDTERERDARTGAQKSTRDEGAGAESACRDAEAKSIAAEAARTAFNEDSTRRNRAHEIEVRRARERVSVLESMRDMRSHGLLTGDDGSALESTEIQEALATARAALAVAQKRHETTTSADVKEGGNLKSVADKLAKAFKDQKRIATVISARIAASEQALHKASVAHAAAVAAQKIVNKEYEELKKRVDGQLSTALAESEAKHKKATDALAALRQKCEQDAAPLRHTEEAEHGVLKGHQKTEMTLVEALDKARTEAAEAHEDAIVRDDGKAHEEANADFNALVLNAESEVAAKDSAAQEAAAAITEAAGHLDTAQAKLDTLWKERAELEDGNLDSSQLSMSNRSIDSAAIQKIAGKILEKEENIAALEARIVDLGLVLKEKEAARSAATLAVKSANDGLQRIRAEKPPMPPKPLEQLVRVEIEIVVRAAQARRDKEVSLLADTEQKSSGWAQQKEVLIADLHRASLDVIVAQEDVAAATKMVGQLSTTGSAIEQ